MSTHNKVKRGYFVSKQEYNPNEPCFRAVEIAYSSDHHAPYEHASPGQLGEGSSMRYPTEAVSLALSLRDTWEQNLRREADPETLPEEDVPCLTITSHGGMFTPVLLTKDELIAWAENRWNGLQDNPYETQHPLTDDLRELQQRAKDAEARGIVRFTQRMCMHYAHHLEDEIDMLSCCAEEAEERKELLYQTIERHGIHELAGLVTWNGTIKLASMLPDVVGKLTAAHWAPVWDETLDMLDRVYQDEADALAERATYACIPPDYFSKISPEGAT